MPSPRQTKVALLALALLCALLAWRASERLAGRPQPTATPAGPAVSPEAAARAQHPLLTKASQPIPAEKKWLSVPALPADAAPKFADSRFTNRLRNTDASLDDLVRNDRAVLLRNALVDTTTGEPLPVPAALRSEGDPGAYVVQATGVIGEKFRRELQAAGLEIVSYIPNNAYLVRGSQAQANQAAAAPEVAAVLPYEPYFKLEPELLNQARTGEPLPAGAKLILTVPDPAATMPELAALGAKEIFRERGPFGTLVTVEAPADSLVAFARVPGVQLIEKWTPRVLANDRAGFILGSTTNAENTLPHLGLTGDGIWVNVNDSGVDATHPDLEGRVFTVTGGASILTDPDGHGTHVSATIAGDGTASGSISAPPQGSVTNANFQGKAPKAKLFILPVDLLQGPPSGDSYLQEEAARGPQRASRNNPLISNNSWGYTTREYSSQSASYDAAVRDALPGESGSQPILYVFSAGNEGFGGNGGLGGLADSISAPGNAKNVITVGALESARNLTNAIVYDTNGIAVKIGSHEFTDRGYSATNETYFTNEVLKEFTDTDYQVAGFSSRGNVGIGIEGEFGRFKPDVVAPGSFILSARSAQWRLENQLPIGSDSYYLFEEIEQGNAPSYRYESGTSMSAPAISGFLAQMQEYFEKSGQFLPAAAFKAILINSARETSQLYVPNTGEFINYTGWGEPNLKRALRGGFEIEGQTEPLIGLGGTLATGEALTFRLQMTATNAPLRLSLVWTDPAGNPVSSSKLVNDLDLVVSNTVSGEVFFGNDLEGGFSTRWDTNSPIPADRINNVERVLLRSPLVGEFVVSVVGHRVNVNARTDHPDNVVQDFALAFATDDETEDLAGRIVGAIDKVEAITLGLFSPGPPVGVTNGAALLGQVAGANSPLINGPLGTTNQWRFYLLTNTPGGTSPDGFLTNGSNVAFVIFPVDRNGNLSRARTNGPDLDLYVSLDASLTNLNPTAIDGSLKSRAAGGIELIAMSNQPVNSQIYYVGVKSEDQQSGQFGFVGISTDRPFTSDDGNGGLVPLAIPLRQPIPDGTPDNPGSGAWLAISLVSQELRRVTADVTTTHENFPDLLGQLEHGQIGSVLNNHGPLLGLSSGSNIVVNYDDSGSGQFGGIIPSVPSDGPGSLNGFLGLPGGGPWFFTTVDNALGNTGRVDNLALHFTPNDFGEEFVERCVRGRAIELEIINVPADASRLTITITNSSVNGPMEGPLEVYVRRENFPDINDPANNDKFATIVPPGGELTIGVRDVPPLRAGRYYIAVYNPNAFQVCYRIRGALDRNLDASFTRTFTSEASNNIVLPDEARAFSRITVDDSRPITAMEVGLRVEHPRVSDLDIRLLSPTGARTVLIENRGGFTAEGLGREVVTTNEGWQHVALTYEKGSARAALYVDGRQVAAASFPGFTPVVTNRLYFAQDPSQSVVPTRSPIALDDAAIWLRSLRAPEIQQIYLDGVIGFGKQPTSARNGLVGLWRFDGNLTESLTLRTLAFLGLPEWRSGQIGQALNFPRPSYHARLNEGEQLFNPALAAGITLESWVRYTAGSGRSVVMGFGEFPSDRPAGPTIFVGLPAPLGNGTGSISALLGYDATGSPIVLRSPANVLNNVPTVVTNTIFASFSDDTNRAFEPIKFVAPPFSGQAASNQLVLQQGFESEAAGFFQPEALVEGWRVLGTNQVQVVRDGVVAHEGFNFLALRDGRIRRAFNTVIGQRYRLSFVTRKHPSDVTNVSGVNLLVDGVTNRVINASAGWVTNEVILRPVRSSVTLELAAGTNGAGSPGLLVDTVRLEQLGGTLAFLPEEPLKGAVGGNGAGEWQLEVTDARGEESGRILSWQITLTFAPTNPPAYRLTNGVTFTTNVVNDDITYFIVEVPPEVFAVTNTLVSLTGGPLNLLFSQTGLPDGLQPDDYALLTGVRGVPQFATLFTNLVPSFRPGQRYYLGVQNSQPGQSNSFAIRVDFGLNIVPLTNNVPYSAQQANRGLMDYYSFDVSPGALGVTFAVTNLGGDVNLVARRAPNLPTRTVYDYSSTNLGTLPEEILIDPTSTPVPLTAGRWYLGVYASDPGNVTLPIPYTIVASELRDSVKLLTNGVPTTGTILTNGTIHYYYLDITNVGLSATFALTNLSGNADLFVSQGLPLPGPADFDFASTNAGTADELIFLTPASAVQLFTPGRWFIAVVPLAPAPLTYTLLASFETEQDVTSFLDDSVPFTDNVPGGPTTRLHRFDLADDFTTAVLFEIYDLSGEADLFVAHRAPPATAPVVYSQVQPGNLGERVVVTLAEDSQLGGTWYLEVRCLGTNAVSYTVRAATKQGGLLLSGDVIRPVLQWPPTPGGNPTITWNAVRGEVYEVQYADDLGLSPLVWLAIPPPVQATGDTAVAVLALPDTTAFPFRFYRIIQVPSP